MSLKTCIESLDLSGIKKRIVLKRELPLNALQVDIIEKWYKRFLYLFYRFPDKPLAVSKIIDDYWHLHLLDTWGYQRDCDVLFGKFLHHNPYVGLNGEDDIKTLQETYEYTENLMFAEFGENMSDTLRKELGLDPKDTLLQVSVCSSRCDNGGDGGNDSPPKNNQ